MLVPTFAALVKVRTRYRKHVDASASRVRVFRAVQVSTLALVALITACVDTGVHQGLLQMHENEGSWEEG